VLAVASKDSRYVLLKLKLDGLGMSVATTLVVLLEFLRSEATPPTPYSVAFPTAYSLLQGHALAHATTRFPTVSLTFVTQRLQSISLLVRDPLLVGTLWIATLLRVSASSI
jgi:hypothetical protein